MTISFDSTEFLKEWLKAFPGCVHLKTVDANGLENGVQFGILLKPSIQIGQTQFTEELAFMVRMMTPAHGSFRDREVVVIGKGMGHGYTEKFVWRGTPEEFKETWGLD